MVQERTFIVTGPVQGIAETFIKNNDFVAIFDLNKEGADSAAEKMGKAEGYQVDVANEESIKSAGEKIVAERGTVDVLINNAGVQYISPIEEFPVEKWHFVLEIILKTERGCYHDSSPLTLLIKQFVTIEKR